MISNSCQQNQIQLGLKLCLQTHGNHFNNRLVIDLETIAIKRLTRNDCAFKDPKSKSHQIGFNLPLRSFKEMFQDLATDESVRVVIRNFVVKWYDSAEREIVQLMHAIKFYHSKGELRMVDLNHAILKEEFEIGSLLLFKRNEIDITVTIFPPDSENKLAESHGTDLITKLPNRKSS